MNRESYDPRNLSSLLGYAVAVHERSGGVCQLCGYGGGRQPDFDMWRQLTVEHLIGEGQGGYLASIREVLAKRFPDLDPDVREELAGRIDAANTITACAFCNASTSRSRADTSMTELIERSTGSPEETYEAAAAAATRALKRKRADIEWKLESVRLAFEETVAPGLRAAALVERLERAAVESNAGRGRAFQEKVARALEERYGEPFRYEIPRPIGTPPKPHKFDLVARSGRIVAECKAFAWTKTGNVPSAKITTLREAVAFLAQLPEEVTKILALARAVHERRTETLGEYFVRLNSNLLQGITVMELSGESAMRTLWPKPSDT
jgi:hypothetical protein